MNTHFPKKNNLINKKRFFLDIEFLALYVINTISLVLLFLWFLSVFFILFNLPLPDWAIITIFFTIYIFIPVFILTVSDGIMNFIMLRKSRSLFPGLTIKPANLFRGIPRIFGKNIMILRLWGKGAALRRERRSWGLGTVIVNAEIIRGDNIFRALRQSCLFFQKNAKAVAILLERKMRYTNYAILTVILMIFLSLWVNETSISRYYQSNTSRDLFLDTLMCIGIFFTIIHSTVKSLYLKKLYEIYRSRTAIFRYQGHNESSFNSSRKGY